jgi:MFS transporter, DHA2 family, multidrug resistance protein
VLFDLSRLYGSTIGIALVIFFFYDNTQAMHVALAKNLAPYRAAAHVTGSIAEPGLPLSTIWSPVRRLSSGSSTSSRS